MDESQAIQAARKMIAEIAPKLSELGERVLFGDVWERPQLSKRDRQVSARVGVLWSQFDGATVVVGCFTQPALRVERYAEAVVGQRVVGIDRERLP